MTKLAFCVAVALGFSSIAATAATISLEAPGVSVPVEVSNGFESGKITLIGPSGSVQEYALGTRSQARIALTANALADGAYQYRIDLVGAKTQSIVAADDASGRTAASQSRVAMTPVDGAFRIANGQLVPANLVESSNSAPSSNPNNASAGPRPNDQVIPDDLIVQGNLCAGFNCVNNESFGFDTLRLKQNTLRIAFADTSVGAFPATNWELTANDSTSGGANRFSIADITAATVPFTVTGAAPSNSLFVSSLGRIGLGTATPVLKVHVAQADTPAVRLDQDGSAGFAAQVWDVAGNEANFFVRDVTGGNQLPLRIRPGAPTSSVDVAASGNVGIGTASPAARLDVMGDAIVRGTLSQLSSRTAKENFALADGKLVLAKLEKMPISTWNYRGSDANDRHLGPVAEDFHEAFGLGTSDHFVAPTDMAGVALASVKALQDEISERDQRIAALEKRLHDLEILVGRATR